MGTQPSPQKRTTGSAAIPEVLKQLAKSHSAHIVLRNRTGPNTPPRLVCRSASKALQFPGLSETTMHSIRDASGIFTNIIAYLSSKKNFEQMRNGQEILKIELALEHDMISQKK